MAFDSGAPASGDKAELPARDAPEWFSFAMSRSPRECVIDVDDCPIRVLRWGDPDRRPLVFVHGNAAHAEWWSFIAPFFATTHSVAAFDLSGMGESGEREDYSPHQYGAEIIAVVNELSRSGACGRADIVAHSFGGLGAIFAAHADPKRIGRLVIIDTPLRDDDDERPPWRSRSGRKRLFSSRADALATFRLLPPQPCANAFLLDYVKTRSVRRQDDGWTWRFSANPWNYAGFQDGFWTQTRRRLSDLDQGVSFIRGQDSDLCGNDMIAKWRECRGADDLIVTIPAAHHHVMLDQPIALIGVLRTMLGR